MNDEEYKQQVEKLLQQVPSHFHQYLVWYAWDCGHATGGEQVIYVLRELIEEVIIPSLKAEKSKGERNED